MKRLSRWQDVRFLRHFHSAGSLCSLIGLPFIVWTPIGTNQRVGNFIVAWGLFLTHWGFWQGARAEDPTKEAVVADG